MDWKQPLKINPTVPFGRLLMHQLVRPSKEIPNNMKIVVRAQTCVPAAVDKNCQESKSKSNNELIPKLSGGRIANQTTLNLLAVQIWHTSVQLDASSMSSSSNNTSTSMHTSRAAESSNSATHQIVKENTILVTRETTTQQPAIRPVAYTVAQQHPNRGVVPQRPMTKRANYTTVSWHGPRCNMSKKWRSEINPSMLDPATALLKHPTPPQVMVLVPRPPLQGKRTTSRATPADRFEYGSDGGRGGTGGRGGSGTFLDAQQWPASFSRIGKADRRVKASAKKKTTKKKNYSPRRQRCCLPPLDDRVGGSLVKIGATFLPSLSRRMR